MQLSIDIDQLEQPIVAEFIKQAGNDEPLRTGARSVASTGTQCAQCPGAYRAFELFLLVVERSGSQTQAGGLGEPAADVPHRCELGLQLIIGSRTHRRHGQRNCAPPLAPGQHHPGPAEPQRVPLAEARQLGAVCRGLRTQLGGPEHAAVLVNDIQTSTTGVHEALRVADGFCTQRLGQPRHRTR